MTPVKSILGAMKDRVKTDLRLPKRLVQRVEEVCIAVGIPKNAFFALAAGFLLMKLSPLSVGRKRKNLLAEVEKMFQKVLAEAKKQA